MWSKWPCVVSTRRTPVAVQTSSSSSCSLAASTSTASPVPLAPHDEDVVLVGTDDELVDPDVRRLVVRRDGPCGRTGTGHARRSSAPATGRGAPAWKLDRSVKYGRPRPMDFRDTPAEAAFRAEVRAWLAEHLTGEFAALGSGGGPADETGWDVADRVGAAARRATAGSACRGPRSTAAAAPASSQQVIFNEEYAKAERAGADLVLRRGPVRPDADPVRHRRAEAALPPEDPGGRGAVVPGVLGAERRLRPRQRPDPRRARRRRVGDQRPEGVDDARAPRRLVLRRVPHRSRVDERTTGLSYLLVPDAPARRRGAAAPPDDRERGVQRGVLRRRPHREGERARPGRRRLEGRDGDARLRARHRVPVPAARVRARAARSCSTSRTRTAPRTTPAIRDELAQALHRRCRS